MHHWFPVPVFWLCMHVCMDVCILMLGISTVCVVRKTSPINQFVSSIWMFCGHGNCEEKTMPTWSGTTWWFFATQTFQKFQLKVIGMGPEGRVYVNYSMFATDLKHMRVKLDQVKMQNIWNHHLIWKQVCVFVGIKHLESNLVCLNFREKKKL